MYRTSLNNKICLNVKSSRLDFEKRTAHLIGNYIVNHVYKTAMTSRVSFIADKKR